MHRSGMTMSVGKLITELQKYDPSIPVLAIWENVGSGIRPENFSVVEYMGRMELHVDVEDYG